MKQKIFSWQVTEYFETCLSILGNQEISETSFFCLPSKYKTLGMALENWKKSAIELSVKVLIYLISWISLPIFCEES